MRGKMVSIKTHTNCVVNMQHCLQQFTYYTQLCIHWAIDMCYLGEIERFCDAKPMESDLNRPQVAKHINIVSELIRKLKNIHRYWNPSSATFQPKITFPSPASKYFHKGNNILKLWIKYAYCKGLAKDSSIRNLAFHLKQHLSKMAIKQC